MKQMNDTIPMAEEVDLFFKLKDKIEAHAKAVCEVCTPICSNEEVESVSDDGNGWVSVGVWSRDCGHDAYSFPKEYLCMTCEEIERRIEEEKRKERERKRLQREKTRAEREARKAAREAEKERQKEEAERKEYERLKEKFERITK